LGFQFPTVVCTEYDEKVASNCPSFSCFKPQNSLNDSSSSIPWSTTFKSSLEVSPLMCSSPLARTYSYLKSHVFSRVKMDHWNSVLLETMTFTQPPADEYDRPEEIQEIQVNRIKAKNLMEIVENEKKEEKALYERNSASRDAEEYSRYGKTLFSQLTKTLSSWDDRTLRKSFMHVQDASQPRCFYVKFKGEGVDDHGGPYREVIDTAISEESVKILSLATPCPNATQSYGENRHLFVFNHNNIKFGVSDTFTWGRMVGLGVRHHMNLSIPLPTFLWKALSGDSVDLSKSVTEYDTQIVESISSIQELIDAEMEEDASEMLEIGLSEDVVASYLNGEIYQQGIYQILINLFKQTITMRQSNLITSFFNGLKATLPYERFSIFAPHELEMVFCGVSEVNIDSLRKVTEYEEPVSQYDEHVQVLKNNKTTMKFISLQLRISF